MKRNHKKLKNRLDFSFCFPYLASLNEFPVRKISRDRDGKDLRKCSSSSKNYQQMVIKTYTSAELSQKLLSKYKLNPERSQKGKVLSRHKSKSAISPTKTGITNITPQMTCESLIKARTTTNQQQHEIRNCTTEKSAPTEGEGKKKELIEIVFPSKKWDLFDIAGVTFRTGEKANFSRALSAKTGQREEHGGERIKVRRDQLWERKRRDNIETIIRRNCSSFTDTILEFYKRAQIESASMIYLFDSTDTWMKNVLNKHQWKENKSKTSKAYHLYWGYGFPKDRPYPEQRVNHYPNTHRITTKSQLHQLLQRYQADHIQPSTYDLDSEQDKFISQHNQHTFSQFLETFLNHFDFKGQKETEEALPPHQNGEAEVATEKWSLSDYLNYILTKCHQMLQANQNFTLVRYKLESTLTILAARHQLEDNEQELVEVIQKLGGALKKKGVLKCNSQNIWIVKSKTSSKGAGTFITTSLATILRQRNRIVQKYVENPLLLPALSDRKFDIRVWMLAVGGGPHWQLYYFKDFYCRVCSQPYSTTQPSLKNEQVHLTNYAVNRPTFSQKNSSVFFPDQLFASISSAFSLDFSKTFYNKVQTLLKTFIPILKQEVCRQDCGNCFELFGVDILLDSQLDLYLLEINMSARCEERHPRLSSMLEAMGEGILSILEDKENLSSWVCLT